MSALLLIISKTSLRGRGSGLRLVEFQNLRLIEIYYNNYDDYMKIMSCSIKGGRKSGHDNNITMF
jgi:hypothetical protein